MADLLRWLIMFEGLFAVGSVGGLYVRVARFALPTTGVRLVLIGVSMLVSSVVIGTHHRLGDELNWRIPLSLIAMTLCLAGLGHLWVWFRRPPGRRARHDMIAAYMAERMLREARVEGHLIVQEADETGDIAAPDDGLDSRP